jgi:hypothetical protein
VTLPTARASRLPAVRPINNLLSKMSEFGDKLPASVVIYALAAVVTVVFTI